MCSGLIVGQAAAISQTSFKGFLPEYLETACPELGLWIITIASSTTSTTKLPTGSKKYLSSKI